LASKFIRNISHGKRRYLICPAYFAENGEIIVYKPQFLTSWIYKKTKVKAEVKCKPVTFSNYKKVSLRVTSSDPAQMTFLSQILRYAIYEQGRVLGTYPLDSMVMAGGAAFFIKKEQVVKFILDEGYSHLLELKQVLN